MQRSVVLLTGAVLCFTAIVRGQHSHGQHEHKPLEFKMPETYKQAVDEIEHRLHEISDLITSKKPAEIHAQAEVIQKVGKIIGRLALKDGSGVPKEAVREINLAGKDLAAKFDAIDKAGDSGDLAGAKKIHEEMVKLAEVIAKFAPKVYQCPMKCEGDKTYDVPGDCPKCGMDLQDVKAHMDHEPKHGGQFFMTPDQKHHLEATLSQSNELRVYFYDEYTKPIAADRFTARGTAWKAEGTVWSEGEDKAKAITLATGPEAKYLITAVDPSIKLPVRVTLFIDFKDGQKPPSFSFEFKEPSKEPEASKEKHGAGG